MRSREYDFSKDINAAAFEYSPSGIIFINEFGKIFHANQTVCDKFGYAYQKLTEMHIWDVDSFSIDSYEKYLDIFEALKENRFTPIKSFAIRRDGQAIPVQIDAKIHKRDNEEYTIIYIKDHTEEYVLEQDKEIYSNMISSVDVPILVVDVVTNKILSANSATYKESGYSESELKNLFLSNITREYSKKDKYYDIAEKLNELNKKESYSLFITKIGKEIPVEIECSIKETNRNSYKICVINSVENRFKYEYFLNKTNKRLEKYNEELEKEVRKRTKELNISKERLELALSSSSDGFWDWDVKTNQVYFSPRWKEILGYEEEEIGNNFSTWKRLVVKKDKRASWQLFNDFIRNKDPHITLNFNMKHKSGKTIPIECKVKKIFDKNGDTARIVGTYTDVSRLIEVKKQKEYVEKQLKENEKTLNAIFNSAQTGLVYVVNRIIVKVNEYTVKGLGYDSEYELLGQSTRFFYASEEDYEKLGEEGTKALTNGVIKDVIFPIKKKDGSTIKCELSGAPLDTNRPADLSKGVIMVIKELRQ